MGDLIKFKRGLRENLPTLEVGELAYCTDTKEVFIGTSTGNQNIISSRLANFQNYFDQVREVQEQDIKQDIRFNKLVEDYYNMFGDSGILTQEVTTETDFLSKRASKFAPMKVSGVGKTEGKNKIAYVNKTIDDPIAELNGHTLREVFEDGNRLLDHDFESLNNWGAYNGAIISLENGYLKMVGSTADAPYVIQSVNGDFATKKIYGRLKFFLPVSYPFEFYLTAGSQEIFYSNQNPTSGIWHEESNIVTRVNSENPLFLFRLLNATPYDGKQVNVDDAYFIVLNDFGLQSLSKADLDYYYSLYKARKNITKKVLTYADIFEEFELAVNNTFDENITGWNPYLNATISWENGRLKATQIDGSGYVRQLGLVPTPLDGEQFYASAEFILEVSSNFQLVTSYGNTGATADGANIYLSAPANEKINFSTISTARSSDIYWSKQNVGLYFRTNIANIYRVDNIFFLSTKHFDELITKEQLDSMLEYYLEHQDYEMADMINPTIEATGKNLFDKDSVVIGEFINHSNGNVESNVATFLSSYIQVKPSTQYVFNPFLITYVLYDVDKNYITGADGQSGFTTTSNSYYVRFRNSTSLGGNMSQSLLDSQNAQLEQGTTATTYEPYRKSKKTYLGAFRKLDETTYDEFNEEQKTTRVGYVESIDDELVGYNGKTLRDVFGDSSNVQSVGKNLFDLEAFKTFLNTKASTSNAYIDGVILNAKAAGGVNFVPFDFLNFKPLTQYTLKMDVREVTTDQEIRFRIYYDDGTYTQLIAAPLTTSFATFSATSTAGKTVTYMTLVYSYPSQYELRNIQLEQGTTATAYEPYIDIDILVNDWSLYYEGVLKHLYDPDDIFGTNEPTLEEFESLLHAYELLQAGESSARYLLPEPIVEPIQTSGDTHLLSYPNGFIIQSSLLTNIEQYTTEITFSYPIESLDKLIILNRDGTQTNLDTSLAVIASDNLSLTHPDLTLNDFIYYEATVKDSLNYTDLNLTFYRDSDIIVDNTTGDLVKWKVTVNNGVFTLEGDIV